MGAKNATRALAFMTRTGSSSTRLSRRGHGFEFSTWEDEDPAPQPAPRPPPEQVSAQQRQLEVTAKHLAQVRADLAWFKERMRLVRDVAKAGDAQGAAWLCDTLGSMPSDLHPGLNPVLAATWVCANIDEKSTFANTPISEVLARKLAEFTRMTRKT